jgi:hypothetical protein
MREAVRSRDDDEGRARDQVVRFQDAVDAGFREEMAGPIRELPRCGERQFSSGACPIKGDGYVNWLSQKRC